MVNMLFGTMTLRMECGPDGLWVLQTTWVHTGVLSITRMMHIVPMSLDMTGCTGLTTSRTGLRLVKI